MPPNIVSRSAWGANPLHTPAGRIRTPTPELWLHHTAASGLHGSAGMRSLQAYAKSHGYVDLEYSWVIDNPNGIIYESRGAGRNTAATGGHNEISHAICVMGNFEAGDVPSEACINSIAAMVHWIGASGYGPGQLTGPHRDASGNSTACCGRNLIARIGDINARARGGAPPPTPKPIPPPPYPPYPGTPLRNYTEGHGTRTWQQKMHDRGWAIGVDDKYGGQSENACRQFQAEKHLAVDGIVGPQTWNATWTAPVT